MDTSEQNSEDTVRARFEKYWFVPVEEQIEEQSPKEIAFNAYKAGLRDSANKWKTIETAPKNGSFWVFGKTRYGEYYASAHIYNGRIMDDEDCCYLDSVTHWMERPPKP